MFLPCLSVFFDLFTVNPCKQVIPSRHMHRTLVPYIIMKRENVFLAPHSFGNAFPSRRETEELKVLRFPRLKETRDHKHFGQVWGFKRQPYPCSVISPNWCFSPNKWAMWAFVEERQKLILTLDMGLKFWNFLPQKCRNFFRAEQTAR